MYKVILLAFSLSLSLSGNAYGDLKVLFTFDSSGVKAHRIVEIASTGENYPASVAELPVLPVQNMVMMKWLDAGGQLLAVSQMPDPRVTSSPGHLDPSSESRVGLLEGAWASNGPDGAALVQVEFSQNDALGLALDTWRVSLRDNN